ncbi:hypothetical protein BKA63DRAFT_422855 [Paraphoma chrysanthemicola]|nr:hypothetical protein BKA63DRAFT_422855 [Paraphoma chrysanthemicola]
MAATTPINNVPTVAVTGLPTAMTAAAFVGIAWYLCAELNVRLVIRCTRRSLYFWSCLLCSWGIIIHSLSILLANFEIWKNYGATVVIHLTWCTYVVSQSVVLYSRLNLVLKDAWIGRYVLYMIISTGVIFGLTTVVLGLVARHPNMVARLGSANLIWDRIQLAAFFLQETLISLLYIRSTSSHLKNMTLLGSDRKVTRRALRHLIYVNVFIIVLDCSLIGLCYAGFFFLQGFYKVAVYAVKLRTEFTILNQLRSALPGASSVRSEYARDEHREGRTREVRNVRPQNSQDSDVEMVGMRGSRVGGTSGSGGGVERGLGSGQVRKDIIVTTTITRDDGRPATGR